MRETRTLLAQKIHERRQTYEEFADYAEHFAREHDEPGTLSARHLRRLAAGKDPSGDRIASIRPATARLLERIFDLSIDQLLAPPTCKPADSEPDDELCALLDMARRVDRETLDVLREQLNGIRRLDRWLGTIVAYDEARTKIEQVQRLLGYCITPGIREPLAALAAELFTLAGWQALDLGNTHQAWRHYENAKVAALESGSASHAAYARAEQAFVLLDVGHNTTAVQIFAAASDQVDRVGSPTLRAWMRASHGESLAANGEGDPCQREFETAAQILSRSPTDNEEPYIALDESHLARWRGHALAQSGDSEALTVLTEALDQHDSTFARAETALRVDLMTALATHEEPEAAREQARYARRLATQIGSVRHQRRIDRCDLQKPK